MTEIPTWWLVVSAIFFVFGTGAMLACIVGLVKILQALNEIKPQIQATATRVEQVATRVEEVAETVKKTVDDLSGRAKGIAGTAEGMVNRTATVVANQSPWIVGIVTAIKLFKAYQEMQRAKTHKATNGTPKSNDQKALPKPHAKAKA